MQAMRTRSDSTGKNWVKRGLNLHLPLFFCQKCCKPVSNIYSGSRVSSSNKAIVGVDYLGQTYWILQAGYCNADRTTWKLTLQDINTTPKELKTERDCSHRQLFHSLWGSSVWCNNQRSGSDEKISAHSDFRGVHWIGALRELGRFNFPLTQTLCLEN